jgi:hypothetical protein
MGSWYVAKQVLPVAGRFSYSTTVPVSVSAAAGYYVAVYYSPTVGSGTWTATAKSARFPVASLTVTSPTSSSAWRTGSTQTVAWTVIPAMPKGEFCVWIVTSKGTWYVGKQVLPVVGQTACSTTIPVNAPPGAGCKVAVYWRPVVGAGAWVVTAKSPAFSVMP